MVESQVRPFGVLYTAMQSCTIAKLLGRKTQALQRTSTTHPTFAAKNLIVLCEQNLLFYATKRITAMCMFHKKIGEIFICYNFSRKVTFIVSIYVKCCQTRDCSSTESLVTWSLRTILNLMVTWNFQTRDFHCFLYIVLTAFLQ